jgi:hypothetical protein
MTAASVQHLGMGLLSDFFDRHGIGFGKGIPGFDQGAFTLVEGPQGDSGLDVQETSPEDQEIVRRVGGFLFPTAHAAEEFGRSQQLFGPHKAPHRYTFSHRRIDGLRIYVYRGGS